MSEERAQAELMLLQNRYPAIEHRPGGWCRLARYELVEGWSARVTDVAFQIPADVPGQAPYGFWTSAFLMIENGGPPGNTSGPVQIVFGEAWQQWSIQLDAWQPGVTPEAGTNMVDFARAIEQRLTELN